MPLFPYRPKGEILCHARRSVHNGSILREIFWRISAPVFGACDNTIKGRLYTNQINGVKACLYDKVTTKARLYAVTS